MLKSIAELAALGSLAVTLVIASLPPERVTAANSATSRRIDRGRMLFATKGCIGCHTHGAVPAARMSIGPDLSALGQRAGRQVAGLDATAYVRESLTAPAAFLASASIVPMPDLALTADEVDALVAFLLSSK